MDEVQEIKNRLDIVEVVRDYVKLKKAGANFRALCPFHNEKKPSLFVSPTKQIWKCFGCSAGGDLFDFVQEIEGVEFRQALEILAKKAGVKLKKVSPKQASEKKRLFEILDLSCRFFEKQLAESGSGKKAEKYLVGERKINKDSIEKWRLGYAPDKWRSLTRFLISSGYSRREIEKAGVGVRNQKGSFYDRFRGRIIFPIFDFHSRVIGFGGRVFAHREEGRVAKYLNTKNSPLYNKSKALYGLNQSKVNIRKKDGCVISEGYTDVILSHQTGVGNIVASSGTALTAYQLRIIKRYTDNLYFAFDADTAGRSATQRGISLAQKKGFDVHVILMPGGHDPADVISEKPGEWEKMVGEATGILDFYFATAFEKYDKENPKQKKKIAKDLLPVVKRIPNEIERFHWVQELARRLEVTEQSVEKEMRKIKLDKKKKPKPKPKPSPSRDESSPSSRERKNRARMIEDQLLTLFLQDPETLYLLDSEDLGYFSDKGIELFAALKKSGVDRKKLKKDLPPLLFQKVKMASLRAEAEMKLDVVDDVEAEVRNCLAEIKKLKVKKKMKVVAERLKKAEKEKEKARVEALAREFKKLSSQIES